MNSQKPYLIRAIHEWCVDHGFTPFLAAMVDEHTNVPKEYVQQNQIILNIADNATRNLVIDGMWITFQATFSGVVTDIAIPLENVTSIFAQENGQGLQFTPPPTKKDGTDPSGASSNKKTGGLKLVK